MELPRGTKLGPYELVGVLGSGGMGVVYRATDRRLERDVALKLLPAHSLDDPLARARFEREAKAIAALSHPNVLAIFDFDSSGESPFIVTELLEGETVRKRLAKGPFAWRKTVEIGSAIAEGLAAAHAKGIIHRDLKPENVFLTADGRVKVLDFGLARQYLRPTQDEDDRPTEELATGEGRVMGTLGYLSPEQLRGMDSDHRSDIFALGCVMLEMLTGKNPFLHKSNVDTVSSTLRDDPIDPDLLQTVPLELIALLRRCLEKNRDERFQSAHDLAFALRALATGVSGSGAVRIRPRRRLWPAFAAVALIAAIAAGWFFISRAKRGAKISSIAVLPFSVDERHQADDEALADGLTESLIHTISRVPRLSVMSASSVFRYKKRNLDPRTVGRELHVDALLIGRLDRRGSKVLVGAELVEAASGRHLWGESYERTMDDMMSLHEEIARDLAASLSATPSALPRRGTSDSAAYQSYVKGRFYWNKRTPEGFARAIEHFRDAIARDPRYALAYAGLADSYLLQAVYGQVPPRDTLNQAREAALEALAIDPDLAEARTSLAYLYRNADGDLDKSVAEFERALAENPSYATAHHWYALTLADLGETRKAVAEMERAAALDPLSPAIYADYAGIVNDAGNSAEALLQIRKAFDLDPDFPFAHHINAEIHLRRGNAAAAIDEAKRAYELGNDPRVLLRLAQGYMLASRPDEAAAVLKDLEESAKQRFVSPVVLARLAVAVRDYDKALTWLEKAPEVIPEGALARSMDRDPLFAALRGEKRFQELRKALRGPA